MQNSEILHFDIELTRHSGKKITVKKGNQMISANDRLHFAIKMQLNQFLRDHGYKVINNALGLTQPLFTVDNPCNVFITIDPPSRRRMDPPNWYPTVKPLVDGMTDANLWEDDNHDIVKTMLFKYGKCSGDKKYHLHFDIIPVKNIEANTKYVIEYLTN